MIVYFGKIFGAYDCRPFKFKGAFIKIFGAPAEDGHDKKAGDKMLISLLILVIVMCIIGR